VQTGYITARVYTSGARIPVRGATFAVVSADGTNALLGIRFTDENGKTELVSVEAPDASLSVTPGNKNPFTLVNVRIDHPDFKSYFVGGVQIFAGQISVVDAELLPTAEHIPNDSKAEVFDTNYPNNL